MKFLEKVFTVIALIGILINLAGLADGVALIALALICLSLHYLMFGFFIFNDIRLRNVFKKESYTGINAVRVVGSVISAVVLSISIAGILFRLVNWNANVMVLLTALGINIIFTFTILLVIAFKSAIFYKNILVRSAIFLIIMACLAITPSKYLEKEKRKVITMQTTQETRLLEKCQ